MSQTTTSVLALLVLLVAGLLLVGCGGSDGTGGVTPTPALTPEEGSAAAATATEGTPAGHLREFGDSPLLVRGRDSLSVCVATAGELDAGIVAGILDEMKAELEKHPNEPTEWIGQPEVARGCPPPTALTGERIIKGGRGKIVKTASPHAVFIYVVPADDFEVAFADAPYGTAIEEMLCQGHQCAEVTTGVYVTEFAPGVLRDGIVDALGLVALGALLS